MSNKKPTKPTVTDEQVIEREFGYATILPPTRSFEVGEMVELGNIERSEIIGKFKDGSIYKLRTTHTKRDGVAINETFALWFEISKFGTREKNNSQPNLAAPDTLHYRTLNSQVSSLLSRISHFGVEFCPSYQRGYAWTPEQKQALITTLLERGSIGTFSFNRRSYGTKGPLYEIVDGKQRLTALNEFFQDQFSIKGKYFSELTTSDQSLIENAPALIYDLEEASEKDILILFLRVNRAGTPVDQEHINKVQARLNELLNAPV